MCSPPATILPPSSSASPFEPLCQEGMMADDNGNADDDDDVNISILIFYHEEK